MIHDYQQTFLAKLHKRGIKIIKWTLFSRKRDSSDKVKETICEHKQFPGTKNYQSERMSDTSLSATVFHLC